jgi:chromosome partitioning protein
MTRVLAIANLKGGIAKTTTVFALGDALATRGQRVLLVDLDPQASLTLASGHDPSDLPVTIYDALLHYTKHLAPLALADYRQSLGERLDLLPSNLKLTQAEKELQSAKREEYLLDEALAPARGAYDVVLIDCPPSFSLLTMNALTAADQVLIPLAPEYLSVQGLALLLENIRDIRLSKLNPELEVAGVVLTLVDARTTHNRDMVQNVERFLAGVPGGGPPILGEIKRSIRAAEAAQEGLPVTRFTPAREVGQAYEQIAERLLGRWAAEATGPATMATRG